jgi:hypothetical protein
MATRGLSFEAAAASPIGAARGTSTVELRPLLDGPMPRSVETYAEGATLVIRLQRDFGTDAEAWLLELLAAADADPLRIDLGEAADLSFTRLAKLAQAARAAPRPVSVCGLTERQMTLLRYLGLSDLSHGCAPDAAP